mgnify:CR=1 FL=1
MNGNDSFGSWYSNGYLLCSYSGMKFWMYKEYDNKIAAGQTGNWEHLMYESDKIDNNIDEIEVI